MTDLPTTMSAAVYRGGGVIDIEERAVPALGPDQVLVEVDHCGICGTDIHLMLEGMGQSGSIEGHEWSGVVAAIGDNVVDWAVGDAVVGGPSPQCGLCRRCLEGKPSQCQNPTSSVMGISEGAFAGYIRTSAAAIYRLPPGLSLREAALAEPLAVALHGITRAGVTAADTIMVFGAGPIGALTVAALKASGFGPVTVIEPNERRRQLALNLGADEVLDPSELEVFEILEAGRIASRACDVVLECSGKGPAIQAAFNQVRRGGTLMLVGAGIDQPALNPLRMIMNEIAVSGSFLYDAGGIDQALALLASGDLPTDLLIEPADVTLDQLGGTLRTLAEGSLAGKAMVAPGLSRKVVA
jgi:(R,R)-butanediol dehydrogenase / meso-butanediol dehydrogenase / diacetyl reductase